MQAAERSDRSAIAVLHMRQQLLDKQLNRAAARQWTPDNPPIQSYPEELGPIAALCREVVMAAADRAVERTFFRPGPVEVAKCAFCELWRAPESLGSGEYVIVAVVEGQRD